MIASHPALDLAALGMRIFPAHTAHNGRCSCNSPQCQNPGKHPRFPGWQAHATTDPAQIQRWRSALTHTNWGYAVDGAVLDVDPRNGGDESLQQLQRDRGAIPDTWRVLTGGGGEHHYFILPDGVTVKSGPLEGYPGLDIKTLGSLVIAPGSVHASGRRYEWDGAAHPEDMPRAEAPAWLIELARRPRSIETAPVSDDAPITQSRNVTLTSLGGRLRRSGLSQSAIEAALLATNAERCQPPLSSAEVCSIAKSIARYPAGTLPPPPPQDPDVEELRERLQIAEAAAMDTAIVRAHNLELAESQRRASRALQVVLAELSSTLKPSRDKLVGIATVIEIHERKKSDRHTDPDLGVNVTRAGVAAKCGLSEDSVTAGWKALRVGGHDFGRQDVARKVQDDSRLGYHQETDVWLKPSESIAEDVGALLFVETPRKQGGKRPETPKVYCDICKSTHTIRKQYTECQGCSNKWDDTSYDINQRNEELAEKARLKEEADRARLASLPAAYDLGKTLIASDEEPRETLVATPLSNTESGRLLASHEKPKPQTLWTPPPPGEGIEEFDPWVNVPGRLN